ncbi:MAG TPA: YggT family protein [Trichocoleus sp.]|jgi:YggT family protein
MYLLLNAVNTFIGIYTFLLLVRIILTWFPTIDWYNQPWATLGQLTDPYLNIFRSIIPPLGGIDFSPMLAILLLQVVGQLLSSASVMAYSLY